MSNSSSVSSPGVSRRSRMPRISFDAAFVPTIIVILLVILSIASPVFLSSRNLAQVLLQISTLGIAAVGATYVIISGDLDLSIGANVALSGVITAIATMRWFDGNWVLGVALGLGCGILIGLFNGLLSAILRVPAFIATLGVGVIAGGLALWLTNGLTVSGLPAEFAALATTNFLGLQTLVWFMLATFVVGGVVLHFTNHGLRTFAVGGNREAAFLSGVPVARVRILNFAIAGLCGGLAGVLLTARVQAGQPGISTTLTLYATAAVILGGTSLLGGQGSMLRTFFGVLLIGVVQNGLDIMRVDYALKEVAVGTVFVLAAASEALRRRR
ncbi:MAG: ABC transporter permease [Actinomycetota bacterium]|nr:ABC transporter permease [Actinomycetota bacterium]